MNRSPWLRWFCMVSLFSMLGGCASMGYMSQGRYIQPAYQYAFDVPAGWTLTGAIPERFEPYYQPFKPRGFHGLNQWHHEAAQGYLCLTSRKSMYPYIMVEEFLFGQPPSAVLARDSNAPVSYWDGSSEMGSLDFVSASTVRIKERWDRHFQKGLARLDKDDALTRYKYRVKRRSEWKGYWEEWDFSLDGTAFRARQETLFFHCDKDKTCMASITAFSPQHSFPGMHKDLKEILGSFQRLFPFEKPYR